MQELRKVHVSDSTIRSLVLSNLDKDFAVLGAGQYIGRFSIIKPKFHQGNFPDNKVEKWTGYRDICFITDAAIAGSTQSAQDEALKLCVIGTDGKN
jgi:hypothetical protein